jgi:hypothetical protein
MVARELTPMERWQIETSRQGAWDNIARVASGSGTGANREATGGGSNDVGTDDGSWWPHGSVRGRGEA